MGNKQSLRSRAEIVDVVRELVYVAEVHIRSGILSEIYKMLVLPLHAVTGLSITTSHHSNLFRTGRRGFGSWRRLSTIVEYG
jgi:hypothetical protein